MKGADLKLCGVEVIRCARSILSVDYLHIAPGSFVGIIGTNGAGKTTLLKVFCGLIKLNRGTVAFDKRDIARLSSWSKANLRKRIGYIPQATEYNSDLPFTAREIVAMGRTSVKPLLVPLTRGDYETVDEWMDRFGLSDYRSRTFRSLSGGEKQKILIARAMVQGPELLMLDEPCSNLDFKWKYQITEIIDQLHQQTNVTVLMVSHDTSLLPSRCGRIILLHYGKIVAEGDVSAVLSSGEFESVYGCRVVTTDIGGRKYAIVENSGQQVSL
jgi:iron complex transport system ATP-binding protein